MDMYVKESSTSLTPREKLKLRGVRALSTNDLFSILIGTGSKGKNVYNTAREIARKIEMNNNIIDTQNLDKITGVGFVKSSRILAAVELGRRFYNDKGIKIKSATDIYKLLRSYGHKNQEYFITISIDGSHSMIKRRVLFIGTLNKSLVHPREVFHYALKDRAAALILVHNHPSNNVNPSNEDIDITKRLKEIGDLIGIDIIDHVIIGNNDFFSFCSSGLI